MRRDATQAGSLSVGLKKLPDDLLAQGDALHCVGPVHGAAVLAQEIYDAPPAVPLLHMPERERGNLGPPQSTAEQHG